MIRDPIGDHLLTPQNAALLVIDEQPSQIAALGALTLLGRAGSSSRSSSRRVSSWPMRLTFLSNSDDAPTWSAWWCE